MIITNIYTTTDTFQVWSHHIYLCRALLMMHDELSALEVIKKGELLLIMHFYYFFALLNLKALSTAVPVYFIQ